MSVNRIRAYNLATILLALIMVTMAAWQVYDYVNFRTAGPRFTAADGQELCERVRAMETALRQPGPACRYLEPPP